MNESKKVTVNEDLIEQVMRDPEAPLIAQTIQERLEEEQRRREEFYNSELIEEQKVEFINGEIIVHSPVRKRHNEISTNLFKILDAFVVKYDLGFVGHEKIMIRLTRNDYEPDVCYFDQEQTKSFDDDTSLFPPPKLVVEIISPKTADRDRGIKYSDYEKHRIPEYWIIAPEESAVEQYLLDKEEKVYKLKKKSDTGTIEVYALSNLKLPIESFFDRKLAQEEVEKILKG